MTGSAFYNKFDFFSESNLWIDISIPLRFDGEQPNAFGVESASSKPCEYGPLVGDTRRGGSCNFEQITLIPHCNGTHTECVGHITHERISVRDCLQDVFIPAVLVSVEPEDENGDLVLSGNALNAALRAEPPASAGGTTVRDDSAYMTPAYTCGSALIVRTLPNDDGKLSRRYDADNIPPYFTADAMEYIVKLGFKHLLVDLPSIDRIYDYGKLTNHRYFWNVAPRSFETNAATRIYSTITELIYVPNEIRDGEYLLNLQIAPFDSDAAPSRPILFSMQRR